MSSLTSSSSPSSPSPSRPPIPPPPATQCLASETFNPPPLDGSMALPEIFDWHLLNSPDHPLFVYDDDEGAERVINWGTAVRAVHRAARIIQMRVDVECVDSTITRKLPVVGILASSDTITFFTTIVGIMRAGYAAFPISTRNSPAAVAHLLQKADVAHVLVGHESALQILIADSLALIQDNAGKPKPTISVMLSFEDVYRDEDEEGDFVLLEPRTYHPDDPAFLFHSSGSTAFPKPIVWSHYQSVQLSLTPYFGEIDFTGRRLALHSMPMFHGMGIMQTGWTATCGVVLCVFRPRSPAIIPEPDNVMRAAMATKSDVLFCVPSFVEAWSQNPKYVEYMKSITGVVFGGGPLNKAIGDALWEQGVGLFVNYGISEVGVVTPIIPKKSQKDWEYFRIAGSMNPRFIPDGHGHAELVILPSRFGRPCIFNTTIDSVDAYASSDLLAPHPTKPGYWKVHGRVDDQIMHSTGEKTNPGPLETILKQDPHVLSAVMFGRGRFYPGVIVDPKPEFRFDPVDEVALADFRNLIWSTVERMNEYAPQHSRIFKEMILVSSPQKPFTYTAKNTARRQAIIAEYDAEIDALYTEVQKTTQSHIAAPAECTRETALEFIRTIVSGVMKRVVGDSEDMFEGGCDSLQAIWIRNTILNALEKSSLADPALIRSIPGSFVYHHPTIESLASYVLGLAKGTQGQSHSGAADADVKATANANAAKIDAMHAMLRKYSSDLRKHVASPSRREEVEGGEVVLVTGTTGWLGSLMLAELLQDPDVKRVYALNRKVGSIRERQVRAFEEKGIDAQLATSNKLVLLDADLTVGGFGLCGEVFDEMTRSVTHIIHNAYPVDFNKSLASFESAILGHRRLIDLALSSSQPHPPRFVFISSVSSVNQHPGKDPVQEELADAQCAVGLGYSESKWVCEHLLDAASTANPGLKTTVVRVAQMCGTSGVSSASVGGCWNTKEWVPALLKSSIELGCLPLIENDVCWIPIDLAARAVCEMRNADTASPVLHLAHPNPVAWSTLFTAASQELCDLPLVPYTEWVDRLTQSAHADGRDAEASVQQVAKNPALRILDFFQEAGAFKNLDAGVGAKGVREGREAMGTRLLALDRACSASPTLSGLKSAPLGADSVRSWIAYWRGAKFF